MASSRIVPKFQLDAQTCLRCLRQSEPDTASQQHASRQFRQLPDDCDSALNEKGLLHMRNEKLEEARPSLLRVSSLYLSFICACAVVYTFSGLASVANVSMPPASSFNCNLETPCSRTTVYKPNPSSNYPAESRRISDLTTDSP